MRLTLKLKQAQMLVIHPQLLVKCERLFSTAGLIFVPKRTSLSDNNFDKLVFLKQNGSSLETGNFLHQKLDHIIASKLNSYLF